MPMLKLPIRKGITKTVQPVLSLPNELHVPSSDLRDYTWLVYGEKKIGKTTFAANFPSAYFLMFEKIAQLSIYQSLCSSWEDAINYVSLLEAAKKKGTLIYKTIIIDGALEAYQRCLEYTCKELEIDYPREDNFGKDWNKIKHTFRELHRRILALEIGVIVLCHQTLKESQTRTGDKFDQVIPELSKGASEYYKVMADNVVWYHYRGNERWLLIKGSDYALAGVAAQSDEHFLTSSGEQIYAVPAGTDPKGTYIAIENAFNNKQKGAYKNETDSFIEVAVKKSVREHIIKDSKKQGRR
jgi:hypothetical protein